jgi:polar amino acid transport system substrate-binding protein
MVGAIRRRDAIAIALGAAFVGGCRRRATVGSIIVGSSPTGAPFSFVDPWTNELTGAMIDTVNAVGSIVGLNLELAVTPFSALIPSLMGRKIDLIAAAMLRTRERERLVAFTDPIFPYPAGLVVRGSDAGRYPDLAALREMRVGAQVGSRFIDQLTAAGVGEVRTYDGLSDIIRDVSFGRIDAGYGDEPIFRYQLRVGPHRNARLVAGFTSPAHEELCLVLRKGDPLLGRLNAAITQLQARAIPGIASRWHLEPGT